MAGRDADMYKVTLKSWLYERINENKQNEKYKGLHWMNEAELTFKLPWVTESDPHWEAYYKLFHDWAERDGTKSTDSQKAKRNFRSALNHSKHFVNIKELGESKQTGSYKVYKFRTQEEIAKDKNTKQRNCSEDSSSSQMTVSPATQVFQPYQDYTNGVHIIANPDLSAQNRYALQQQVEHQIYPQNDLNLTTPHAYIQSGQMPHTMGIMHTEETLTLTPVVTSDVDMISNNLPSTNSDTALSLTRNVLSSWLGTIADLGKCTVTVEYNGRKVSLNEVDFAHEEGTRVLFHENSARFRDQRPNDIFLESVDRNDAPGMHKILENMKRGILFTFDKQKMQIEMRRDCLAHAYYFVVQLSKENEPVDSLQGIRRKEKYKIFSYETFMHSVLDNQVPGMGSCQDLSTNIEIVVGVQPRSDQIGKPVKGVKIIVQPVAAQKIINKEIPLNLEDIQFSVDKGSLPQQEMMQCDP